MFCSCCPLHLGEHGGKTEVSELCKKDEFNTGKRQKFSNLGGSGVHEFGSQSEIIPIA